MKTLTIDSVTVDIPENFHQVQISSHIVSGQVHAVLVYHYVSIGLVQIQRVCAKVYELMQPEENECLVKIVFIL